MIDKIGLEVEGGWKGTPRICPLDIPIIVDRSIDGRTVPPDKPLRTAHVGEVVSQPMEPTDRNITEWIEKYWPDATNNTCGYHIHLSFTNVRDYSLLTRKTFLYSLVDGLLLLGKESKLPEGHYIWQRLTGINPFATLNFDASSQIRLKNKRIADRTRYGFLNCCWGIHRTMEFRALPTFNSKVDAVNFTLFYRDFVNRYLNQTKDFTFIHEAHLRDEFGTLVRD